MRVDRQNARDSAVGQARFLELKDSRVLLYVPRATSMPGGLIVNALGERTGETGRVNIAAVIR